MGQRHGQVIHFFGHGKLTSVDYYLAILNVYFLKTERG